jgi:hypothetical protein
MSEFRDSAGPLRRAAPGAAGSVTRDLEQAGNSTLIDLTSQGSRSAFSALFDRTFEAAWAELSADFLTSTRRGEILAASYVEVWWLAGCHRAAEVDAASWIISIVRRRVDEAARWTSLPGAQAGGEGPRPSYAELELAALLLRPVDDLLRALPGDRRTGR